MKKLLVGLCCAVMLAGAIAAQGAPGQPGETPEGNVATLVSPQTLLLGQEQGGEVTVHAAISFYAVDTSSLEMNGVPLLSAFADNRGELVVKFDEDAIKAIVETPSALLTLEGLTIDGVPFTGADIVTVKVWEG